MVVIIWASQVAQWERIHLPMQENQDQSLGQEDPPEKKMALQYSCLGNPVDRLDWQATVHSITKESDTDLATKQQSQHLDITGLKINNLLCRCTKE